MMHTKIDQKYKELQLEIDRLYKQIETNIDQWKGSFTNTMKKKVGCVLMKQLDKYEIDGVDLEKARNEFSHLKGLFNLFNVPPLISVVSAKDNQVNLNEPHVIFRAAFVAAFNCLEDFSMENTGETMKYSYEQHIDLDESTNRTSTGNYTPEP